MAAQGRRLLKAGSPYVIPEDLEPLANHRHCDLVELVLSAFGVEREEVLGQVDVEPRVRADPGDGGPLQRVDLEHRQQDAFGLGQTKEEKQRCGCVGVWGNGIAIKGQGCEGAARSAYTYDIVKARRGDDVGCAIKEENPGKQKQLPRWQ